MAKVSLVARRYSTCGRMRYKCLYFPPDFALSTAAAMLQSSIVRVFTLRMVGSWLSRVMGYPSSVVLTDAAICAAALVAVIVDTLFN